MGKASCIFYYNKAKSMYLKMSGNMFLGIYNKDNEFCGVVMDKCDDMFKWSFNDEIYIIRWFKRKGFCAFYKITNNDINLREAEVWAVPDNAGEQYKWWKQWEDWGIDVFGESFEDTTEDK